MKFIVKMTGIIIVLMSMVSVYAEGTVDYFFDVSVDLKSGETTVVEKELTKEKDFSKLWVVVTKTTADGDTRGVYEGQLGSYDNGRWNNIDFSDNRPFLVYDWQTQNAYCIMPIQEDNEISLLVSEDFPLLIDSQIRLNGINTGADGLRIIDNANMTCLLNVSNSSDEDSGLTAILATYDAEGKLYNASTYNIEVEAGQVVNAEISYQFDAENEATGKMMFWDSTHKLMPIRASIDFSQTSGVNAYYYNSDNRLLQVDKVNGKSILFTYDNMGNLLTRTTRVWGE